MPGRVAFLLFRMSAAIHRQPSSLALSLGPHDLVELGFESLGLCLGELVVCLEARTVPIQTAYPTSIEGDDFDPVCAPSCRVASNQLQRAGLGVDHVGRDRVRLFAGDDDEAAGRVDIETAWLLLG